MRGRHPTPTALKLLQGTIENTPFDEGAAIEVAIPDAPAHLNERARSLWQQLAADLKTARLISKLDQVTFALLCDSWAEYVHADEMIARPAEQGGGYLVKTPNGYEVQSPWVTIRNKAFEKLMKVCVEFGLTPSARNRVRGGGQMPLFGDDDPMEAFLRAGKRVAPARAA